MADPSAMVQNLTRFYETGDDTVCDLLPVPLYTKAMNY